MRTLGRQDAVAAATLAGVFALVFGPGVLTSLRAVVDGTAVRASSAWTDRVAALEWDVFTVAVVLVVVVRWLPRHAPVVTGRMLLARPPAGRLVAGTAAYAAIAAAATWLGDTFVSAAHLTTGHYPLAGGLGGVMTAGAAATAAGVTEEITLVALAAAVVGRRWSTAATLAVLVALRLAVHLYYLWGSVFVLAWVPGAYLVYRWAGSVWPLVAGHWLYDWLALTAAQYPGTTRVVEAVLWPAGVVAVVVVTASRPAARSSSCYAPS